MDISWSVIGKVLIAGLGTYVFLPVFLVFRDFILWKLINTYILNKELEEKIRQYAIYINLWNTKYAIKSKISNIDGETTYLMEGKEVTGEKWNKHHNESENISKLMEKTDFYIRRKSNFLNWLLKHYKQDSSNPIDAWLQKDIERIKNNNVGKKS